MHLSLTAALLALAAGPPRESDFRTRIAPLLARHCVGCHGKEKPKAGLRLGGPITRQQWQAVLKRVEAGEMPPPIRKPLPAGDALALTGWIRDGAAAHRAMNGRVPRRRLNRVEYENTVRDLLGIDIELQALLPIDIPAQGFDNVAEGQHVSMFLMERYLEAAEKALAVAITNGPRPPLFKKRLLLGDERFIKKPSENVFRVSDGAVTTFTSSPWQALNLWQFYPPDRGRYRFRISARAVQSGGKPVTFRVIAGPMLMATKNDLVGYFDAPAGKAAVTEFTRGQEARSTISILPYGLGAAHVIHKIGADKFDGAGLQIDWVEVEGPLHDTWPPAPHRRIFGDLPQVKGRDGKFEVVSKSPQADAERILLAFARRAFRRDVAKKDIAPLLALVEAKLAEKHTFEQAVRVGLAGVMVSPDFLFLRERPGPLDNSALASRLSYFLWNTTPDDELLAADLKQPETLRKQTERLLKSPKAGAFVTNFVGQWLGLRDIDATEPSHILYPEFDEMLKASMVREAETFFAELLKDDLPISNVVTSDFAMLNGRLAKHYGIAGVDGWAFRKVKLPAGTHRGGVLTMAGVLKVTANGTTTSPVTRGAWVMERIMGVTPPKPPDGIPAVEPDTRGATTIREQLTKHRAVPSCNSCHKAIDPPGFALESFDVIGGWRETYRSTGNGKPVMVDGRRMHYLSGPKVDPSGEMEGGKKFAGIDEFKALLLKEEPRIARALAVKLVTFATGGAPEEMDKAEMDAIMKAKGRGGLRSLVHAVIQSKLFREK